MKILIIGAGGHIGSFLSKKFPLAHKIYSPRFKGPLNNISEKFELKNLNQTEKYFKDSQPFSVILFLVGLAHKKGSNNNFDKFNDTNFITLKNVILSLKKYDKLPKKFIYASSISVYGESFEKKKYLEISCKNPKTPYSITKLKAENYLNNNLKNRVWILRLAPVYSENFTLNIDRRIKFYRFFYQIGKGEKQLSLCNIKNIGKVIEGITKDKIPSDIYNISDSKIYIYKDLIKKYNPKTIIKLPRIIILLFFFFGKITRNTFLIENSIKLASDNLFISEKICKFVNLDYNLD